MEDKCKTGRVTIPTDLDVVPETLEILKKWGADAIRDCDGTEFPQELKDTGAKIYAPYYTTRTLGEAFLAKCDFERLRSFEPLFEGEAGPAQAARAALLPNTFLQALVCRALTGRVPPEEMET